MTTCKIRTTSGNAPSVSRMSGTTNVPNIAGTMTSGWSAPDIAQNVVSSNGQNICGMNGTSMWTAITTDAY